MVDNKLAVPVQGNPYKQPAGLQAETSRNQPKGALINYLRTGAERLANHPNETVLFPGWHPEAERHAHEAMVRSAAKAILAEGVSMDAGTTVTRLELAAIVSYIADMFEE